MDRLEIVGQYTNPYERDRLYLKNLNMLLTLIWVGFLGVRFEVDGGKTTLPPHPHIPI